MDLKTVVNLVLVGGATILLAWPLLSKGVAKVKDMFAKDEPIDLLPGADVNALTKQLKHIVVEWPQDKCDAALPLIRQLEELAT